MKQVQVTLTKSIINRNKTARATVRGLGLKKMHQTVVHTATPQIMGMIRSVDYLLRVEEVKE